LNKELKKKEDGKNGNGSESSSHGIEKPKKGGVKNMRALFRATYIKEIEPRRKRVRQG